MRFSLAPAIIAAMVMVGCAQFGFQPIRWIHSPQPIEPEALRPSTRPAANDLIVLLPKPNGPIGGVIVRTEGGKEILLDKAYAGAHIGGPGMMQPVTYDADRAKRVREDLIKRGISADRIEVSGRGKREPLVPTPEGVSEPMNRRVEVNVR